MSDPYERDGGHYVESFVGICVFSMASYSGLWIVYDDLGGDMIDYEQYINGRIEATIPCQLRPRDETILL